MNWNIHVIQRKQSNLEVANELIKRITIHIHDGSTSNLINIIREAKPLAAIHLASLFIAQHTSNDIESLIQSNLLFSTQLTEAMAVNDVKILINAGTSWQNYENKDYSPVCLYAAMKQAYEAILQFYVETAKIKVITLKLFDTYGPGDWRPKLLKLLKDTVRSGAQLNMSPGGQLIDLVYIDDVVDAFIIALERSQTETANAMETFGVSSANPIPLKDIIDTYQDVSGTPIHVKWGARDYRPREVMHPWTNFNTLPGWTPKVRLRDGIYLCLKTSD